MKISERTMMVKLVEAKSHHYLCVFLCVCGSQRPYGTTHSLTSHTFTHAAETQCDIMREMCVSKESESRSDITRRCVFDWIFHCWSIAFTPCSLESRERCFVCVIVHYIITYCCSWTVCVCWEMNTWVCFPHMTEVTLSRQELSTH